MNGIKQGRMKTVKESQEHEIILKVMNELEGQIKGYLNIKYPEEVKKVPWPLDTTIDLTHTYFSSHKTFRLEKDGKIRVALYLKKKGNFSNTYIDFIVEMKVEKQTNGFYVDIEDSRFYWPLETCNTQLMKYLSNQFLKAEIQKSEEGLEEDLTRAQN